MEAKNMEIHNVTEAVVSDMSENQLRDMVKYVIKEVKKMGTILEESSKLKNENNNYKLKEKDNRSLKRELRELRKQLQARNEFSKSWKEEQEYFFEREEQLNQVTKERDFLSKQHKELISYKHECFVLRKESRDLKVTQSRKEEELMKKIHVLELEVEKLQKATNNLESNLLIAKNNRGELAQKDKALLKEKRRCSDLEEQLERAIKELDTTNLPPMVINILDKPYDVIEVYQKNLELKDKLVTMTQQLTTKRRQLEKKDHIIVEKEKQCEELKHSMSRLLPPERLELIPKCQWVIREQSKKIKALMGHANMFQIKAEEYKSENEKLVEKVAAIKKLYLKERMQNTDLREALKKSGAKQVPEDKSGATQVPPSSNVLHKQSREKQVHTKMQTLKSSPVCLPPTSNKFQLEPDVKLVHTRAPTVTKKVMVKSEEKSDLSPITKGIHYKSKGKSAYTLLPPISGKSLQVQSRQTKIFITEKDGDQD